MAKENPLELWERVQERLDSQKFALMIIDMQNDFVSKDSPHRIGGALKHLPKMREALDYFRKLELPVIHIIREYKADGSDIEFIRLKKFLEGDKHAVPGTAGAEIVSELKPGPGEFVIVKPRFSAFMHTELDAVLRRHDIGHIVVAGINLANCVRETIYDGVSYGYDMVLLTDAAASTTDRIAEDNIRDIGNIGVTCLTLDEFKTRKIISD